MQSHHTADVIVIKSAGPLEFAARTKKVFLMMIIIGLVTFLIGLKLDAQRVWVSFLHNHFFFMSLGLGGIFLVNIQLITGAIWSASLRRLMESLAAYVPIAIGTSIFLFFGLTDLYPWSRAEVVLQNDILMGKKAYLNDIFFMIRTVAVPLILWFFARFVMNNSLLQDHYQGAAAEQIYKNMRYITPVFFIVFTLGFSVLSFDQIMSLDPYWFSTIFGVYCFAGLFYSSLALLAIVSIALIRKNKIHEVVNENHLHDIGKFMFAFNIFWAYIAFSQFMLIWYANLPEETSFYLERMHGNWFWITYFLIFGKFIFPFFFLMPRWVKRNMKTLRFIALFMVCAQWMDILWLVQPNFFKNGPVMGWVEVGLLIGFIGVFGFSVRRFWSQHPLVAIGEPRLYESILHHH